MTYPGKRTSQDIRRLMRSGNRRFHCSQLVLMQEFVEDGSTRNIVGDPHAVMAPAMRSGGLAKGKKG